MVDDKSQDKSNSGIGPNNVGGILILLLCIGLASPVYEQVQNAVEPNLGYWPAFAFSLLAGLAVASVVFYISHWIMQREKRGKTDGMAAMIYRPAILPIWGFAAGVIKNLHELTELMPWTYLGWVVVLLTGAIVLQRRRGSAWSWWVAVPIGFVIALVAIPAAFVLVSIVAPDQVRP